MGRRTLIGFCAATIAVVGVAFSACFDFGGDGGSTTPRPDGGPLCQIGATNVDAGGCAPGTRCANRNCVPTCTGGTLCPEGFYCEGAQPPRDVCAPKTATTCVANVQCPLPQICFANLCSAKELRSDGGPGPCTLAKGPDDQCSSDAICLSVATQTTTENACLGMPACGEDGGCPVGVLGSVCNDLADGGELIAGKQRICLFSFCVANENCNPLLRCFRSSLQRAYGECFGGTPGTDPCFTNDDCQSRDGGTYGYGRCLGADGGLEDGGTPGICE